MKSSKFSISSPVYPLDLVLPVPIIEIGSFSIKTIIYSEFKEEFAIIGTGKTRSRGYTGEEIENFDEFIDCIKNSIVQAEKQANYIIRDAYILITNQSVKIKKTQNTKIFLI